MPSGAPGGKLGGTVDFHTRAGAGVQVDASLPAAQTLLRRLAGRPGTVDRFDRPEPLTGREVEVLRLLTGGYSNREIAVTLHLTEGTVKNHVSTVLEKLGVRDRTRAALRGIELGYSATWPPGKDSAT